MNCIYGTCPTKYSKRFSSLLCCLKNYVLYVSVWFASTIYSQISIALKQFVNEKSPSKSEEIWEPCLLCHLYNPIHCVTSDIDFHSQWTFSISFFFAQCNTTPTQDFSPFACQIWQASLYYNVLTTNPPPPWIPWSGCWRWCLCRTWGGCWEPHGTRYPCRSTPQTWPGSPPADRTRCPVSSHSPQTARPSCCWRAGPGNAYLQMCSLPAKSQGTMLNNCHDEIWNRINRGTHISNYSGIIIIALSLVRISILLHLFI